MTTNDLSIRLYISRYGDFWSDKNRTITIGSQAFEVQTNWTRMAFPLDQNLLVSTYEIQLIIEGRINANSLGAIAVDDILLMEGSCQTEGMVCENGVKIGPEKQCNFIWDCPTGMDELYCGNCDFESSSTCGWTNMSSMSSYQQKWSIVKAASTIVTRTGTLSINVPRFDGNGSSNGHFLMMSPPDYFVNSNAEAATNFGSPSLYLKAAYKSCVLQFDYFISTSTDFSLGVRVGTNRVNWATIYYISQTATGAWRHALAHIGEQINPFMADIVGHLDSGRTGVIAVDNFYFTNCSLPTPLGPNQRCDSSQFLCAKNRFCISQDGITSKSAVVQILSTNFLFQTFVTT